MRYMSDFESFKGGLRQALQHINDPGFQPQASLCKALGCDPDEGCAPLQAIIVRAITDLEPDPALPRDTAAGRAFESLHKRYVVGLTQEETAEFLHMSRRNLQRIQAEATHVLARNLWGECLANQDKTTAGTQEHDGNHGARRPEAEALNWREQTDLELASLAQSAPDTVASLDDVIEGVLELTSVLASQHGIAIQRGFIQPGLEAATHPSVLRQTLITAVDRLLPRVTETLTLYAALQDARIKITLTGREKAEQAAGSEDLTQGIITPAGTSINVEHDADHVFLLIRVPSDIVVLDVMLPNIDGWQLLTLLHENLETRTIPVIVSSVVREEGLALALGASCFLSKPIQPRRFVEALNQVLRQPNATHVQSQANNEGSC
jgi:CheY-like chemotaxis protein